MEHHSSASSVLPLATDYYTFHLPVVNIRHIRKPLTSFVSINYISVYVDCHIEYGFFQQGGGLEIIASCLRVRTLLLAHQSIHIVYISIAA